MSSAKPDLVPARDADPDDIGPVINALAADVAHRLATLRGQLEPTQGLWTGASGYLGPADEWTIAADGLLGPNGVLGMISDAMKITLPDFTAAGWAESVSGWQAAPSAPDAD